MEKSKKPIHVNDLGARSNSALRGRVPHHKVDLHDLQEQYKEVPLDATNAKELTTSDARYVARNLIEGKAYWTKLDVVTFIGERRIGTETLRALRIMQKICSKCKAIMSSRDQFRHHKQQCDGKLNDLPSYEKQTFY
jgi:hypothetical protein